jgi:hypothetical protein
MAILILECSRYLMASSGTIYCLSVIILYCDFSYFHNCTLSRVCGGIGLPIVMMMSGRLLVNNSVHVSHIQIIDNNFTTYTPIVDRYFSPRCHGIQIVLIGWVCDILWAISSSFYITCLAYEKKYISESFWYLWTLCCAVKIWTLCHELSMLELFIRIVLFYTGSTVFYYASTFIPKIDRKKHRIITPHITLHFLFVQVYVLFASTIIYVIVFVKIFSANRDQKHFNISHSHIASKTNTKSLQQSSEEGAVPVNDLLLLEQLKRAKGNYTTINNYV